MKLNRYDKLIWRINGALIALGGVIALILMLITGYKIFQEIFRERSITDVVNINEETRRGEYLSLRRFYRIQGTKWLVAALDAQQDYKQSYYSKSGSSTRNYLFFDTLNQSTHWLLNNNSSLILANHQLLENPTNIDGERGKVIGAVYEIVRKDSDGDIRLNSDDRKSVVFYSFQTGAYLDLLEGIDELLGVEQISSNEALIFFKDNRKNFTVSLDLLSNELSERAELPEILTGG